MYLCIKETDFDKNNVIINEKIKNNVINNSYFYRIYYSTYEFTSNGLVMSFNIKYDKIEKYFSKIKILFREILNHKVITQLIKIEDSLLNALNIKNKEKKTQIKEQITNGFLKIIPDSKLDLSNINEVQVIIKISGFWESKDEYGVTFRCLATKKSAICNLFIDNNTDVNNHNTQQVCE